MRQTEQRDMGMFDSITCNYPLPGLTDPSSINFQTKDLECLLTRYTITREGRLIKHYVEYEECPEVQRPLDGTPEWNGWPGKLLGCLRVKASSERDIDTNYHGWLEFYGDRRSGDLLLIDPESGRDLLNPVRGEWFEYRAKFTDGRIVDLIRVSKHSLGIKGTVEDR